ncbi:TPA: ABC transporter permease [Clostridium botulinum]|uniref:ABC transporter permease n=1 Tax=Clostridium botulinum TaxID=1491 RepID=UPI0005F8C56A|nr:ABC transporter permease [Clostridium botulinum]APC79138.1 macB-like periplasmic core domain protein [Clostridium botulinum]APQ99020.1 macB-like periplasmic core domain protein [Clostridium botulinum]APU59847.1 macB-like periplasmic core domain protein [Clostridium botulinum]AUN02563.1 ABC transporter permease [Clostridium botulinum]MBN3398643.1 ABC transporter permease [Clostridium botulinum]
MKWFNVFKLYNLKKIKSEKIVFTFTALSIFVTTLISLLVPQITKNTKEIMDNSIKQLNGGTVMVQVQYPSKKFNDEISSLKKEGYKVKVQQLTNGYYKNNNGKKTIGKLISGEFNIGKDEIILYKSIANNIKAKVGDKIEIEYPEIGTKSYVVKKVENMPYGVDNDSKILGYGKILSDKNMKIKNQGLMFINSGNGDNGEKLKERLKNIEDGYVYTSLKDKEKSVQNDVDKEIMSYSVITEMAYMISIITIITTTIMILLRRKKDFAILKMLSIESKSLKKSMLLEVSLIIIIPVILAAICSLKLSTVILAFNGINELISINEKAVIIFKGVVFNCVLFFLFLNIALRMLKTIKPLSIIREDKATLKKIRKKIIISTTLLIPILLFAYSLYVGRLAAFAGGCLILLFIGIFLLITLCILKLITLIPFKNNVFLYGFKSIQKNFMSFTMILLSVTMTIVFLLIGFTLDNTIKYSMNKTMKNSLPYDHILLQKSGEDLEKILENNAYINKYSKFYNISGKVTNSNIKSKAITIAEVKKQDYKAQYKILEGKDIFQGSKNQVVISNKYKKANKLKVGDFINIESLAGNFQYRIKGIYDGGEFNSQTILKEYSGIGKESISYIIKSNSDRWMDDIKDSYVVSVDSLSNSISSMINKSLDIFKYLCFLCIFSSLLFNMNMVYMNYIENKKDETIIVALGIGKGFCMKYELLKLSLLVVTSTIMAFGIYTLVLKTALKLFLDSDTYISFIYLFASMGISTVLSIITFNLPIRNLRKKISFELLRE